MGETDKYAVPHMCGLTIWTNHRRAGIIFRKNTLGVNGMTDAQKRARDKYLNEKVEDVKFRVPKGKKELIREHAAKRGESVNAFLARAVEETIRRDNEAE